MNQWLLRGTLLTDEKRIKKMISASKNWQIYSTNQDSYVIAVTHSIYKMWVDNYSLPEGIFGDVNDYKVFCSSGNYLIASLDKGPYPENDGQIEAFSIAFNTVVKQVPNVNLRDAVYIEEYALILPSGQCVDDISIEYIYGKWVTGGANISANSFERMSRFMSWLPVESLSKCFELAGFSVPELIVDEKNEINNIASKGENGEFGNYTNSFIDTNKRFVLIGRPDLEDFFKDNIIDIVLNQEEYKRMGIYFPSATILHGPPGCGKTYAVEKLVEYLGWPRFDIDSSTIASSYIHDTSKKISEIFTAAIKAAPSIIVIDEMEAFLSNRNMSGSSGTYHMEEVAEFLRRIPEAISKGVLVFAMTNMIDAIDPAVLRRGRFDHVIEVKMANKEEILALLKTKFREIPIADDVIAESVSEKLDGHPISDVAFVLREAGRIAVKNQFKNINQMCFDKAIDMLPKEEKKQKIGFN